MTITVTDNDADGNGPSVLSVNFIINVKIEEPNDPPAFASPLISPF